MFLCHVLLLRVNIQIEVKMSVQYMSFSAHADAKGIMQLIRQCQPSNVMLVHGEAEKMEFLKVKIKEEFGMSVYFFYYHFMKLNLQGYAVIILPMGKQYRLRLVMGFPWMHH
jgi:Cft2 family RNA processing exonuclease